MKVFTNQNVYEAAQERIEFIFNNFENVLVAFSGGKDSSICLNMCYDFAKEHGLLDRLAIYHLDYEAQYQMTTDYVTEVFTEQFPEIKKYWLCLPISAQCACRMDGAYWIPWDEEKKDLWVRQMPENEYVINESNVPFPFKKGDLDYAVQESFGKWFGETHGTTAVVIGIRADESYNRFRTVATTENKNQFNGTNYIYKRSESHYNAYPIYDWRVDDVWTYNAKFGKSYNHLYDLYYQAGLSVEQMRVASPFNDCAMDTLKFYKVIDPVNWGKMVGRVNGVNMAGLYGGTTAMGWKKITKPDHLTWKEYCCFLLNTLPPEAKEHYLEKLNTSIKFWREKGGCLDEKTIEELKAEGAPAEYTGEKNKRSDTKTVVRFTEYPDDTGVTDFRLVPSYKRMCVCIMKNDWSCKYMGFGPTKKDAEKRKAAIEKWKNIL